MPSRAVRVAAVVAMTVSLVSCSADGPRATRTSVRASATRAPDTAAPAPGHAARLSSSRTGTAVPAKAKAQAVLATMSLRQRVGQLLMVDSPSTRVTAATVSAITHDGVGSVILDGTTTAGSAVIRALTNRLQRYAPRRTRLFIATDQEGGFVQRLQGPGFSTVPAAILQGRRQPSTLRSQARTWGRQLKRAGVTVNLAPVLDTVPARGGANPPIGDLDREYGHTPATVRSHGLAYAEGMADAGIAATVKHFPGLGRVSGNTDTTSGITDSVTTPTDAYLAPFRAAVQAHVPFVMMSTAIYSRIDPRNPAAFSHTIVTDVLRGTLGYRGLIISDDVGAARQVSRVTPGQRAVRFVRAGGDIVLTVVAGQAHAMTSALLAEARASSSFRAQVNAAALLVLQAKERAGLL